MALLKRRVQRWLWTDQVRGIDGLIECDPVMFSCYDDWWTLCCGRALGIGWAGDDGWSAEYGIGDWGSNWIGFCGGGSNGGNRKHRWDHDEGFGWSNCRHGYVGTE